MTKSEFWKNAVPKNVKGQVVTAAVFAYISAAMTLVLGFLTGNFLVLIDVLLVLGLGLGVHLAKSRVCAIILAAYFVLNKVLQWLGGEFSGLYIVYGCDFHHRLCNGRRGHLCLPEAVEGISGRLQCLPAKRR